MLLTQGATARLALGAVILYLGAHGLTGRQGLVSYMALQERERALETEEAGLSAQIAALGSRAARLRTDSPTFDLDYLEERARVSLDAARTDEVVLDLPNTQNTGAQNAGQP